MVEYLENLEKEKISYLAAVNILLFFLPAIFWCSVTYFKLNLGLCRVDAH